MSQSGQADNITMSGGGLYSLATIGAKDVIDAATPMVTTAIEKMSLHGAAEFTLSDMGCADGGTSLDMIRQALGAVRSQNDSLPIRVVYADQPRNDYNALVQIVHGLSDFKSWLNEFDSVYPLASGISFYNQIVPDQSLDLGFSATAMHWLSEKPGEIKNHVHMVGATDDDLQRFKQQAQHDWLTILKHRARELKPGGRLVFANFCRDDEGRYLGNTDGVNMFDTFNAIWMQFMQDGLINRKEYEAMTLPQYYRTSEEFAEPFRTGEAPSGLELEQIETRVVRCPFAVDYEKHGDARRFAQAYIPTIRTWNESTFYGGLDVQRPEQQRRELIEQYYGTYQNMVEENPAGHAMDYVHAYMTVKSL